MGRRPPRPHRSLIDKIKSVIWPEPVSQIEINEHGRAFGRDSKNRRVLVVEVPGIRGVVTAGDAAILRKARIHVSKRNKIQFRIAKDQS